MKKRVEKKGRERGWWSEKGRNSFREYIGSVDEKGIEVDEEWEEMKKRVLEGIRKVEKGKKEKVRSGNKG